MLRQKSSLRSTRVIGQPLRRGTAGFFWRGIGDFVRDFWEVKSQGGYELRDPRYPVTFHINLLPDARRKGLGSALVKTWLASLGRQHIPGCHVQTFAENARSIAFFEKRGFETHGQIIPAPGMRAKDGKRMHLRTLVRTILP